MKSLLFSFAAFLWAVSANPSGFDPRLIPDLKIELPVLTLGNAGVIQSGLIEKFVKASSPNATFRQDPQTGIQFGYDGDRLVSFTHRESGETRIFPNLAYLRPSHKNEHEFVGKVHQLLKDDGIFPKDGTTLQVLPGSTLLGSTQRLNITVEQPTAYLKYAVIQRNIEVDGTSFPVCGPGSLASFGIGAKGQIYSASYLWKRADFTSVKLAPILRDSTHKSILQELRKLHKNGPVRIDGVDLCFYDSGKKYIQPVYRYWGTLYQNPPNNETPSPPGFTGYVSINPSKSPEPVPCLADHPASLPPSDARPTSTNTTAIPSPSPVSQIAKRRPALTVGRYINRNDTDQWWINSNRFLSALRFGDTFRGGIFASLQVADFIDKQYDWAYPWRYTSDKNSNVNSVHIADSEQHGGWHEFWLNSNRYDKVKLSDIPADGYGPGAGGSLAYWIIHSCQVIPSPSDFAPDFYKAFEPWWHIFNGLHAVLGYRTSMWIGDGVMPTFGLQMGLGVPVVSAWLQTVHDDTAHYKTNGKDQLYDDNYRGIKQPMGRASAMVVCGHEGDTVLNVENIGRPNCLRQFWYDN